MFDRNLAISELLADDAQNYSSMTDDDLMEELEARGISYLFGEIDDTEETNVD